MHNNEARALTGVWVTVEFNRALEAGYRVHEMVEVWQFDQKTDSVCQLHSYVSERKAGSFRLPRGDR